MEAAAELRGSEEEEEEEGVEERVAVSTVVREVTVLGGGKLVDEFADTDTVEVEVECGETAVDVEEEDEGTAQL